MTDISELTNKVHCADSLDFMRELPAKAVDYIITDPPYGINENCRLQKSRNKGFSNSIKRISSGLYPTWDWDKKKLDSLYFFEMLRISKNQVIFGAQNYADSLPPNYGWLVWDKDNSGDFSDCELAYTSFLKGVRKFKWRWNGMLQEDMKNKEVRFHPTQKPLALMKWIIINFTKPSEVILDPFLGSGTTAVAAKQLGRNFIGIDINPDYCRIAEDRLKQEILPFKTEQTEEQYAFTNL